VIVTGEETPNHLAGRTPTPPLLPLPSPPAYQLTFTRAFSPHRLR